MSKKIQTIYLTKFSVAGYKGFKNEVTLDFSPSKSREFMENAEFWGLERNKYIFGALKSHLIIGENGSGKSSLLESIMDLSLFMRRPGQFNSVRLQENIYRFDDKGIKWNAEYVTKEGEAITKYFVNLEIDKKGTIENESVSFIQTLDGRNISEKKTIYKVENGNMVLIHDKKIKQPILVRPNNGFNYYRANKSFILPFMKIDDDFNINNFLINGFNSNISRNNNVEAKMDVMLTEVDRNQEIANKVSKLYRLFDENIVSIKADGIANQPIIIYQTMDGRVEMPFNNFISIASKGTLRVFMLLNSIMKATTINTLTLIDEIDASLHVALSSFLVDFVCEYSKGQLFLTSHDLNMTEMSFRNDQLHIIKNENNKITIINGAIVVDSKNKQFRKEYFKENYLSSPKEKLRELIFNLWAK